MNLAKLQICKELLDYSKDAYGKHKQGHGSGGRVHNNDYSYYGYGAPTPASCHCRQGGRMSKDPMQIISSIKNSKQLKALPQTLQGLASLKHGGGQQGGMKKILPQVLKNIKSRVL